jgi:ectoine hydroxylase-related dioxygenase (phytanoyl-CoA dioxygenase family)
VLATTTLRRLTAEERHAYEATGYTTVPDVFERPELEAIDQEIDRLLPEAGENEPSRQGSIKQLGLRSRATRAFAEDARILTPIEEIVKPGIAIYSAKLIAKLPHSDEICHWHQDDAFYLKPDDPRTFSQTRMSVWVPLQDAHEKNGCLWVVPGSHRWGLQDYDVPASGQCRKRITREQFAAEHAIPVPVKAGTAVLFSALTWHHSKGNITDHVRRAFIVSYQEATVPQGNGQQWKILRAAPSAVAAAALTPAPA